MQVVVDVPEEYIGNVIGDLISKRGRIENQEVQARFLRITALVPLASMFGYATSLRSNTQGRGNYTMQFSHYEECPKAITLEIIKKRGY